GRRGFARAVGGLPGWLPGCDRMRDRLIGSGLILAPDLQSERFTDPVRALDQLFLGAASGSLTDTTVPSRRVRVAVPVWHHVRSFWQVYPASQSVCRIVQVLTWGSPSDARRSARC